MRVMLTCGVRLRDGLGVGHGVVAHGCWESSHGGERSDRNARKVLRASLLYLPGLLALLLLDRALF